MLKYIKLQHNWLVLTFNFFLLHPLGSFLLLVLFVSENTGFKEFFLVLVMICASVFNMLPISLLYRLHHFVANYSQVSTYENIFTLNLYKKASSYGSKLYILGLSFSTTLTRSKVVITISMCVISFSSYYRRIYQIYQTLFLRMSY